MILPGKHSAIERSPAVLGAIIVEKLEEARDIGTLWDDVRHTTTVRSFDRFYRALLWLFIVGAIDLDGLRLRRHE